MKRKWEVDEQLNETECIVEYSERKPRLVTGISLFVVGAPAVWEPVVRGFFSAALVAEFLFGLLLVYLSVWTLILCGREYVCVTNQRVLYRKVNALGKRGKVLRFPLDNITEARLCKISVMYRKRHSGEILLTFGNRKQCNLPFLQNGQYVLDAIWEEAGKIAARGREAN